MLLCLHWSHILHFFSSTLRSPETRHPESPNQIWNLMLSSQTYQQIKSPLQTKRFPRIGLHGFYPRGHPIWSFAEESFPDADDIDVPENLQRPFRLSFEKVKEAPGKRPIESAFEADDSMVRHQRFIQEWLGFAKRSTTINNYQQLATTSNNYQQPATVIEGYQIINNSLCVTYL